MSDDEHFGDRIDQFSANGKTFFFNEQEARNGSKYLRINALYGEDGREGMNIFQEHVLGFWNSLGRSIGEIWGFEPSERLQVNGEFPEECPHCGAGRDKWFAFLEDGVPLDFRIGCDSCDNFLIDCRRNDND